MIVRTRSPVISRSFNLGDHRKIGISRMARLKQIRDTLMLSVEQGFLDESHAVSVRELDKLVKEIEGGCKSISKKTGQWGISREFRPEG